MPGLSGAGTGDDELNLGFVNIAGMGAIKAIPEHCNHSAICVWGAHCVWGAVCLCHYLGSDWLLNLKVKITSIIGKILGKYFPFTW